MSVVSSENAYENTYRRWEEEGTSPFFPVIEANRGFRVDTSLGNDLLMFGSCDYLGMSQRAELREAAVDAIGR